MIEGLKVKRYTTKDGGGKVEAVKFDGTKELGDMIVEWMGEDGVKGECVVMEEPVPGYGSVIVSAPFDRKRHAHGDTALLRGNVMVRHGPGDFEGFHFENFAAKFTLDREGK